MGQRDAKEGQGDKISNDGWKMSPEKGQDSKRGAETQDSKRETKGTQL